MSSNQYSIRLATLEDLAGVDALLRASYPALMAPAYDPVILEPALKLMARANPALLACGTYYVAESGALVVGCGGWTREYPGRTDVQPQLAHLRHFGTIRCGRSAVLGARSIAGARRPHALPGCASSNAARVSTVNLSMQRSAF
jgi:hypothetical protein